MKFDDLRDRKDFLQMQLSILLSRLEKYIKETEPHVINTTQLIREHFTVVPNIEQYFLYRCNMFQLHCTDLAVSLTNNLLLSTTRIDYNFFNNLLRVNYAFNVLENRIKAKGFKVNVLVDINTGRIYFNKGTGEPVEVSEKGKSETPQTGKKNSLGRSFNKKRLCNGNNPEIVSGRLDPCNGKEIQNASRHSTATTPPIGQYDSVSSLYKHNFPSMNFLTTDIPVCGYPNLQELFKKPFSISISIVEMNRYIVDRKVELILTSLETIKDMEVESILYFSSVDYYKKYKYNELIPIAELEEPRYETSIKEFISNVSVYKRIPILNLLFNIAPGLIYSVNFSEYSHLPYAYILSWIVEFQRV